MTHPGDPGHAAAARRDALAHSASPAGEPMADAAPDVGRRPWSLHRRLLAILTVLLVAVSVVIGVVTVLVFHSTSVERLDASLRAAAARAADVAPSGVPTDPRSTVLEFLSVPGQPVGTLGVLIAGDTTVGGYISELGELLEADRSALRALSSVPADSRPHTVDAGALGPYRAIAVDTDSQLRGVLALPLADVNAQTAQLALTVAIVAAGGLLLALGIGSIVVRRALSPLSEVTATARRVSELPLDRGDVALGERVPAVDDGTEVGRLGTSFNRMLEHVASALSARERSEQKVRRFVADASHELRTPLASIRGYAELTRLHGGQLPADVVHAFERIESESKRMTELVEDLLLLARLDEGRKCAATPSTSGVSWPMRSATPRSPHRIIRGGSTRRLPRSSWTGMRAGSTRRSRTCSRTRGCTRRKARRWWWGSPFRPRRTAVRSERGSPSPTTAPESTRGARVAVRTVRARRRVALAPGGQHRAGPRHRQGRRRGARRHGGGRERPGQDRVHPRPAARAGSLNRGVGWWQLHVGLGFDRDSADPGHPLDRVLGGAAGHDADDVEDLVDFEAGRLEVGHGVGEHPVADRHVHAPRAAGAGGA
ncbi:hypothetical protein GCM10025870_12720 [Agromyces marinus]|uniref:histidine kinase n=1 Tax=Agromyces marinus TaxID=1389020 RepID=A0ABM8H0C0_9MICO|nr:hypothetical protein GCM10025870_12720 [Agromyces marinus]